MINQTLLLAGDDGYNLTKSLRFRSSASANLNRTPSSTGNRQTWTWSGWVKPSLLTAAYNMTLFGADNGTDTSLIAFTGTINTPTYQMNIYNGNGAVIRTTQYFRDPSAWYHFVVVSDTTNATAANRTRLYVNGVQVTAFDSATYPSQNSTGSINAVTEHLLGRQNGTTRYFDGYLAEVNFVDGQALTPSSFGSTNALTGVWQPAKYTGTYGTNGFYLPFTDVATTSGSNAGLGKDFSGNGNYWNTNNISVTAGTTYDSMTDVPTLTSTTTANTATINPLDYVNSNTGSLTATNGNLLVTRSTTAYGGFPATMALPSSGKFVFEFTASQAFNGSTNEAYFGIGVQSNETFTNSSATGYVGDYYTGVNVTGSSGSIQKKVSGGSITTPYSGGAVGSGDVFQFLVDMTNGTVDIKKNGSAYGSQVTGLPNTLGLYPYISLYGSASMSVNFGQQPFASTPTSGFVALNTFNLPEPSIKAGNKHMDVLTYQAATSNGTYSYGDLNFRPDFSWIKNRDNAESHYLIDVVRGNVSVTDKFLSSNATNAEGVLSTSGTTFSVTDTGYQFVESSIGSGELYFNNRTYVGWNWKANGAGSSNTAGSITSTVSVNPTAGFSVVTYTGNGVAGATVGHGLGVAPSMVIFKSRNNAGGSQPWATYHASLNSGVNPANYVVYLNYTLAESADSTQFNNTVPTSSVFSIGTSGGVNANTGTYVAYCWSEIAGFSKFASYTGNGSTDGSFVYCGFRPSFLMIKRTDTGGTDWVTMDYQRLGYNVTDVALNPNASYAENSGYATDFLSNGFKLRTTTSFLNANGGTYIVMAFASNPFKNALAR